MFVYINQEKKEIENATQLSQLLETFGAAEPFAVSVNTQFVAKSAYQSILLNEGDKIDVVSPVFGG